MNDFYPINQKDLDAILRYLKIHDPDNANQEFAIELFYYMQKITEELVNQNLDQAELIHKALQVKKAES